MSSLTFAKSNSDKNWFTHLISCARADNAMYSASALDKHIVFCFLVDHITEQLPTLIRKPVVDLRSLVSPAQSESQYALTDNVWFVSPKLGLSPVIEFRFTLLSFYSQLL